MSWVKKYCDLNNFEFEKGRDTRGRYFIVKTEAEKKDDDMPF
tara:strand:- start:634 stop:759 length:126 start_codon:yes stop_codon:yes gene_type:complete